MLCHSLLMWFCGLGGWSSGGFWCCVLFHFGSLSGGGLERKRNELDVI